MSTHGDHIRSMTDGELAILINGNVTCDLCIHGGVCTDPYDMSRCIAGVKAYLGQERKADDGKEKEEKPGAGAGGTGTDEEGRT